MAKVTQKPAVGISSCLLGEKVRYDGGHQLDVTIQQTLSQHFDFISFCPEIKIGMGVPRKPIRLIKKVDGLHCVAAHDEDRDYTEKLISCAAERRTTHCNLSGYIFKSGSPSCGVNHVKVYDNGRQSRDGVGMFARTLMEEFPHMPVEEETRLGQPLLRENFIQRVLVMQQWIKLCDRQLTIESLKNFHERLRSVVFIHGTEAGDRLDKLVTELYSESLSLQAPIYLAALMGILKPRDYCRGIKTN